MLATMDRRGGGRGKKFLVTMCTRSCDVPIISGLMARSLATEVRLQGPRKGPWVVQPARHGSPESQEMTEVFHLLSIQATTDRVRFEDSSLKRDRSRRRGKF
jgi:hypothetical protein